MEFVKRDLKGVYKRTTWNISPFAVVLPIGLYEVIQYLNIEQGYHVSDQVAILICIIVFILECLALAFALMRLDVKAVIEDNQLKYYTKFFGKYRLSKQISIDEISHIRSRTVSVISRRGETFTSELFYVIDKKGKNRLLLQQADDEQELLSNDEGTTLLDYLQSNYYLRTESEITNDAKDLAISFVIGIAIVVGFIFVIWAIGELLV